MSASVELEHAQINISSVYLTLVYEESIYMASSIECPIVKAFLSRFAIMTSTRKIWLCDYLMPLNNLLRGPLVFNITWKMWIGSSISFIFVFQLNYRL